MAKEKQTRRMIAMALAAAVTMSSVPVVAFADEVSDTPSVTSESTTTESGDGSMESPRVTVTVTPTETKTTEDGGSVETDKTTTVTTGSDETTGESINKTEVKTETTETSADGAKTETTNTQTDSTEVDADGTTTVTDVEKEETKEYDANGDWVETNGFEEGTETTVKEKTENVPDVTVQLKEGETTSAGGDAETVVEGDVPADENDPEYDYTETTETDRKVTATMGKIETFQSSGNGDANVDAVNPEWTEDKEHVKAPVVFEKYDSLEELQ
ncbi:MAG: hypothetical protein IJN89_00100, partial [Anaerotignum sp.]|nr:hypothetical protein [Anaerotignum sp.]